MKTLKIFLIMLLPFINFSCSEKKMDDINKERNNALTMDANNMLPDAELKTAFETVGIDIAWYATVYTEQSAGTWAQSATADKRVGQNDASLFNNNWNGLYIVLNVCKEILDKTAPEGSEPDNYGARGVAQVLTAYNLAVLTDMWGDVPWSEALKGSENMQPKFDTQQEIYPQIFALLDDAIVNLGKSTVSFSKVDYIYGGNTNAWIKAAYSLKARYALRLSNVDADASSKALASIANGFASNDDSFMFDAYESTATGENPWSQFLADRTHLSVGKTLFDLMNDRNDPRMAVYFTLIGGVYAPAPNGTATESQGGLYSTSLITENGAAAAAPLMTFHELKFIEAEAKFRTNNASWQTSLQEAIEANFLFHGAEGASDYFTNEVAPKLTAGNELKEILTQKYIALYEHEAIEVYNDYRRTEIPTMHNPNNATAGFVNRFPYALSEKSSNPANVPIVDVYVNKVWWAK